jgi:hypothetical protein
MGKMWDKPVIVIESRDIEGIMTSGKNCTKCGQWKPLDTSYFRDKKALGGRMAKCKECTAEYKKSYYALNSDKEKQRASDWYDSNKERAKEWGRKYRQDHKEERSLADKLYRINNAEKLTKKAREYRLANREKVYERQRRWYLDNKDIVEIRNLRRRTRESKLNNDLTKEEKELIWQHFNNSCALTGSSENVSIDHVIPISTGYGGSTKGNIIPLRLDLNTSKCDKNIFVWFEDAKHIYGLSEDKFYSLIEWLSQINGMTIEEYKSFVCECHGRGDKK